MGTPAFALANLKALISSHHRVVAVVTGQDKKSGRGSGLVPTLCRIEAEKHDIPVLMPQRLADPGFQQQLMSYNAHLFVVAAFKVLPKRIFEMPKLGSINVHASLLPKYRGAAPINWAIINGESETGLTSFFLQQVVDTGNIILQELVPIDTNETYDTLHEKLSKLTGPFLLRTLDLIDHGKAISVVQRDQDSTQAPKLKPTDALINFDQPAVQVRNFVRGMSTKPGAYTYFRGKKIKVHFAEISHYQSAADRAPGQVVGLKDGLIVQCRHSVIELTRIVPEGKKEMTGRSFMNGYRPEVGEIFGQVSAGTVKETK